MTTRVLQKLTINKIDLNLAREKISFETTNICGWLIAILKIVHEMLHDRKYNEFITNNFHASCSKSIQIKLFQTA